LAFTVPRYERLHQLGDLYLVLIVSRGSFALLKLYSRAFDFYPFSYHWCRRRVSEAVINFDLQESFIHPVKDFELSFNEKLSQEDSDLQRGMISGYDLENQLESYFVNRH